MPSSTAITDVELKQLESALASPVFKGKALSLDRLQGFLCAVVSSPDTISPGKWLPDAIGTKPEYASTEQAQEIMGLLIRFYNDVANALFAGQPLKLILKPRSATDSQPDYQAWCEGYILGWALSTQEWLRPGNEALKKLTFPILFLSGAFREDVQSKGKTYIADEEDLKMQQECADTLPGAVASIYNFFLSRRNPAPAPVKRETPKVGRNELCPCGSGKKFKQCCGGQKILH
ncbi:hypothetical protein SKTS_12780 [Sulfurimicrobium lacus]|uniref:YecA family protein n=1 Tax=Sulfurimicrobium lacus TaxID=2715678 RepID=A0A6F8VBP9_9PROT|nr:YecA family protein [Sulfurimicrobium lacus]BCB26392.1 hypothetical protein SKTS_12780 [Sulfurimicrobium lacus]